MQTHRHLFMVIRKYGPPYDAERPLEEQLDWEGHRQFMNTSEARGLVRLAGPLAETDEVLLVLRAENADEIDRHLAGDPWTQSGILSTSRILRWNLRLGQIG
jgi:uncharacterized protein YciI